MSKPNLTKEEFVYRATLKHNNKYDYSQSVYINYYTPINIICPTHGSYLQKPSEHLRGRGCPKCGFTNRRKGIKTTDEFKSLAYSVHGSKYDYTKTIYESFSKKVCIICHNTSLNGKEHGEFWQLPNNHLNGVGCPKCAGKGYTTEEIVEELKIIRGDEYDYSQVVYKNPKTKICIICHKKNKDGSEHGPFWQTVGDHKRGQGCPICGRGKTAEKKTKTTQDFIKKANQIHKGKYDYSKSVYVRCDKPLAIICEKHGVFYQTPSSHLAGNGCHKCTLDNQRSTQETFIKKSLLIHHDKYDYSKVKYDVRTTKVLIICKTCKTEFWQAPFNHLAGYGCPTCGKHFNETEDEIRDYIKGLGVSIIQGDKSILKGKEIDIYIPSLKIGIEFDGLFWHSTANKKDINYHLNKTEECEKQGIRLIHIFEDEWLYHKEVVKSKLRYLLGKQKINHIPFDCCKIVNVGEENYVEFLAENSLGEKNVANFHIGAYYKEELIGIVGFNCLNSVFEIKEVCFLKDIDNIELLQLFLTYIKSKYHPNCISIKLDRRWENGDEYSKIGFKRIGIDPPKGYSVVGRKRLMPIENIKSANVLKTENEIYNCGYIVYHLYVL